MKKYNSVLEQKKDLERKYKVLDEVYYLSIAFIWGSLLRGLGTKQGITFDSMMENKKEILPGIMSLLPAITFFFGGIPVLISKYKKYKRLNKLDKEHPELKEMDKIIDSMTEDEKRLICDIYKTLEKSNPVSGVLDKINDKGIDDYYSRHSMYFEDNLDVMDCSEEYLDLNGKYYDAFDEELDLNGALLKM